MMKMHLINITINAVTVFTGKTSGRAIVGLKNNFPNHLEFFILKLYSLYHQSIRTVRLFLSGCRHLQVHRKL